MQRSLGGPHGYMPHHANLPECPLLTSLPATQAEMSSGRYAEPVKAYKLGRGRQSYNMLDVQLHDANSSNRRLDATHTVKLEQDGETAAAFLVQYEHGIRLKLVFHLVYSTPEALQYQDQALYEWKLVCRDHCHAGCLGPILKPISRLDRTGGHSNPPQNRQSKPKAFKDSRFVYLSIDEASSHIGSLRHTFFRLIVGAYDTEDGRLVGTSCSEPIVCVSNNDPPKTAPYLAMHILVSSAWPKWQSLPQPPLAAPAIAVTQQMPQANPPPLSSGRSGSSRSANTSMAYLSQALPPGRDSCAHQPLFMSPSIKWKDDSRQHQLEMEYPEVDEVTRAAIALQEMIALHGSGHRSRIERNDSASTNTLFKPQAQVTQAGDGDDDDDDDSEVVHVNRSYQPNPESCCCTRAKKMRLMSAIYTSPAAL